nr:MAG TPA: hypothetical protein [Caudoviricetes sp.]DAQ87525.1 MAG TPA: hypothetical protein [Caudoviricetes sp.]
MATDCDDDIGWYYPIIRCNHWLVAKDCEMPWRITGLQYSIFFNIAL